ncbi:hypothetical protein [Glycomyces niveus]|uniref:Major facilitator superfamily (MFS) profile domain-containing protein n=1 Tax=Glycomyces niveus TaxID=2820287 RepID=A0ABS3TXU4_9ACTN|nr:hypothetical protein [Glycomyces sp. NEAU-S30]MBO3731335.1 hypothetical protein [Glycomyces sp. NEAU-S30]
MPDPVAEIVRAAYGDATGHPFLISACIAAAGLVAALFLSPIELRETVDLADTPPGEEPALANLRLNDTPGPGRSPPQRPPPSYSPSASRSNRSPG